MIYLFGDVTNEMAGHAIRSVIEEDEKQIMLCTQGGDVMAALAIYDVIKGNGVTVIGTGQVASAGAIILLGGDTRLGTQNIRLLTHAISIECAKDETPSLDELEEVAGLQVLVAGIIAERTGMTNTQAKAMIKADNHFGFDEAIEMGFLTGKWEKQNDNRAGF